MPHFLNITPFNKEKKNPQLEIYYVQTNIYFPYITCSVGDLCSNF